MLFPEGDIARAVKPRENSPEAILTIVNVNILAHDCHDRHVCNIGMSQKSFQYRPSIT